MINRVEIRTGNKYKSGGGEEVDGKKLGVEFGKISLNEPPQDNTNVHEIDEEDDDDDDDADQQDDANITQPADGLLSAPPSDYDASNRLHHIQLVRRSAANLRQEPEKKFKNGTRMSMHFTNVRMREIENCNRILLGKILNNGPSRQFYASSAKATSTTVSSQPSSRITSATINRRKQQMQIEKDNEMLLKKLQKINRQRHK